MCPRIKELSEKLLRSIEEFWGNREGQKIGEANTASSSRKEGKGDPSNYWAVSLTSTPREQIINQAICKHLKHNAMIVKVQHEPCETILLSFLDIFFKRKGEHYGYNSPWFQQRFHITFFLTSCWNVDWMALQSPLCHGTGFRFESRSHSENTGPVEFVDCQPLESSSYDSLEEAEKSQASVAAVGQWDTILKPQILMHAEVSRATLVNLSPH